MDGLRGGSLLQQFPVLVSSTSRGADHSHVGPDDPVEQLQVGDDAGQGPVISQMSNVSIEKICLYMNEMYETVSLPDVVVWSGASHSDQGVEGDGGVGVRVVLREAKP